jgi:hypothetical protein
MLKKTAGNETPDHPAERLLPADLFSQDTRRAQPSKTGSRAAGCGFDRPEVWKCVEETAREHLRCHQSVSWNIEFTRTAL